LACSAKSDSKKAARREVHTQTAVASQVEPKEAEPEDRPGEQSFHEGMVALCESYEKVPKSDDPIESQKLLHAWLEEHVTNVKVREVFTMVGEMPPSQRGGMLRAAAAKVGITHCALAGDS
jgi:hypothetical protein